MVRAGNRVHATNLVGSRHLLKVVVVVEKHGVLLTLNHLVFEFTPCSLLSLLFGLVLSRAQIFSPSLLPLTLEPIKLIISDLTIIETAQILHSIVNH